MNDSQLISRANKVQNPCRQDTENSKSIGLAGTLLSIYVCNRASEAIRFQHGPDHSSLCHGTKDMDLLALEFQLHWIRLEKHACIDVRGNAY